MMVNILKLLEIFTISNVFEVSPRRLRNFWLDLAAAKTPDVQRVRYANASLPSLRLRFRSRAVMTTTISHPKTCVLLQYPCNIRARRVLRRRTFCERTN